MAQYAVPFSMGINEGWLNEAAGAANLQTSINSGILTPNDSTFMIQSSPASTAQDDIIFTLGGLVDPVIHTGHVLRVRVKGNDPTFLTPPPGGNGIIRFRVFLENSTSSVTYKDSGEIQAGNFPSLGSIEVLEFPLLEAEAANITNYTNMTVRVVCSISTVVTNDEDVTVYEVELEVPDAEVAEGECSDVRIDHQNLNDNANAEVNPGTSVYDPDRNKIYFIWASQNAIYTGGDASQNHQIMFREYDIASETFGTPVQIVGTATGADRYESPKMVRLTADGRLVCTYHKQISSVWSQAAKESANFGVTWGSETVIETKAGGESVNNVGLATDGTSVFSWYWIHSNDYDFRVSVRSGVGTWGAPVTVLNGSSDNQISYDQFNGSRTGIVVNANVAFVVVDHRYDNSTAPDSMRIGCFRTTNAGANWAEVTVKDFVTAGPLVTQSPVVWRGSDNRTRAMWIELVSGSSYKPFLAYSDDDGVTWTLVGTPTDIDIAVNEINANELGFSIDPANDLFISAFYTSNAVFRIYKGSDSIAGWEIVHECNYAAPPHPAIPAGAGKRYDAFFAGIDLYHVFENLTSAGSGDHYQIAFLTDEVGSESSLDIPDAPVEDAAGTQQNSYYLRCDFSLEAGPRSWSLHHHAISCLMDWDEGDRETGREINILVGGVPSINPEIVDPSRLPTIYRIEANEEMGRRTYWEEGVRTDPMRFRFVSKEYTITESNERNVCRGILISYRRDGDTTVSLDVIVDRTKMNKHFDLPSTNGELVDRFYALPTSGNLGSTIQFAIEDESLGTLDIETLGLVYIPKGVRGQSA